MVATLEKCATEEQRSLVNVLWAEGLDVKDIRKEILPVYGEKCLSRNAVHSWVANVSHMTKRLKWRRESG
jgi:hypothetical protein